MLDYIIVGAGLAGIAFAETLRKNNKSFLVIDSGRPGASSVAGGIYNPVVLKRFRMVEQAPEYLSAMHAFFDDMAADLQREFRHPLPIYRKLSSVEEQNEWFTACDRIPQYLIPEVIANSIAGIDAPFGFGQVAGTGWVSTADLLTFYREWLISGGRFRQEEFDFNELKFAADGIQYRDLSARHLVFAEGFGMLQNPYFSYLPLQGTKGEVLNVRIPSLQMSQMVKGSVFVMPLHDDLFKVGATYNWADLSDTPTEEGREELLTKLASILTAPYSVEHHFAGVRPTVRDRRPLIGTHSKHTRLHVLNGLGSRGVMLAPLCSRWLYDYIERGAQIPQQVSVRRFDALQPPQDRI